LAALSTLLDRPPLVPLGTQTDALRARGWNPDAARPAALTSEKRHVATLGGRTPQSPPSKLASPPKNPATPTNGDPAMIINRVSMDAVFTNFRADYEAGILAAKSAKDRIAMTVNSAAKESTALPRKRPTAGWATATACASGSARRW